VSKALDVSFMRPTPVTFNAPSPGARLSLWMEQCQRTWRARRLHAMEQLLALPPNARVLDLGCNLEMWSLSSRPYRVVLLNLSPDKAVFQRPWLWPRNGTTWQVQAADATDLSMYSDGSFDLVFSNSLIEHLPASKFESFAGEVARVGRRYWVQTPDPSFPIEPHTRLPFFWFYPRAARAWIAKRIDQRKRDEPWHCPIEETSAVRLAQLRRLFPHGPVYTERLFGLSKSWAAYRSVNP
jgi:Methyltransferase domain